MDTYIEIRQYVEVQLKLFCMIPISDFNNGIIEGLSLVKAYLVARIEDEGKGMAEVLDGNKS